MTEPIPPNRKGRTGTEQARLEQAGRDAAEILRAIRAYDPSGYRKDSIPGYPPDRIPDP
jgi:hypothetical protein